MAAPRALLLLAASITPLLGQEARPKVPPYGPTSAQLRAMGCAALVKDGACSEDPVRMERECKRECERHSRQNCEEWTGDLDDIDDDELFGDDDDDKMFFATEAVDQLPKLRFLLDPLAQSSEALAAFGIEIRHRLAGSRPSGPEKLVPPSLVHAPAWRGWATGEQCSIPPPEGVTVEMGAEAILHVQDAMVTFEGFAITKDGVVFSGYEPQTAALPQELLRMPATYRLSRHCGERDGLASCCLAAGWASTTLGKPVVSLPPLWRTLVGDEAASGEEETLVSPDDSMFYDELIAFAPSLRKCIVDQPTAMVVPKLLVFQHIFGNNYFHFMAQSLPRLLRLLQPGAPELLADTELQIFFASWRPPFVDAVFGMLGLASRVLPYNPCNVYKASSLFMMATSAKGATMLDSDMAAEVRRRVISSLPDGLAPTARPYMVLLDRMDARVRLKGDGTAAKPRHLTNMDEAHEAMEQALRSKGFGLTVLRGASVPFAEQARLISGAQGLVGVHGAGLTNAILLPPGAAVVELIPTRDEIINHFDDELSSKCGYTMFWYLAASRGLRYHALALHGSGWADECVAPLRQLAKLVGRVAEEGAAQGGSKDEL